MGYLLNDEVLTEVVGGKKISVSEDLGFESRKKEFESAWAALKMEDNGFSGMKRAELFDEWSKGGYETDATKFLSGLC